MGLIVPLTGEYSEIGKSIIQSVRMGINKIDNNNILINGGAGIMTEDGTMCTDEINIKLIEKKKIR